MRGDGGESTLAAQRRFWFSDLSATFIGGELLGRAFSRRACVIGATVGLFSLLAAPPPSHAEWIDEGDQTINGTQVHTTIYHDRGYAVFSNDCGSQTLTQSQLQGGAIPDDIIPCPRDSGGEPSADADQQCGAAMDRYNTAAQDYDKMRLGNACEVGPAFRVFAGEVEDLLREAVQQCSGVRDLKKNGEALTPENIDAVIAAHKADTEAAIARACKPVSPPPARTAMTPPKPAEPAAPEPIDLTAAMKKCFAEDVKSYTDIKTADQARAFCTGKYAELVKGSTVEQLGAAWDAALPVLALAGQPAGCVQLGQSTRTECAADPAGERNCKCQRFNNICNVPVTARYKIAGSPSSLPLDPPGKGKSSDIACTTKSSETLTYTGWEERAH